MLHCGSEQEGLNVFYKLLEEFKSRDRSYIDNSSDKITSIDKTQNLEVIGRS